MTKLFLIDGHALIFKMYYAFLRRPMINSKGADMSILFGFTKYILELIEREKPTHLGVAFDPPGGTFRNQIYPEYKANRSETPQLVIDALDPLCKICGALEIPVLMIPGFEADDVIGSMAKTARRQGHEVYMVTPDKDYGQLVEEGIYQYRPAKGSESAEVFGVKEICAKYNIQSPIQVIEMLTICGDASDNVPGVKGVGEVGAGKLIAKYGTVENIYSHIDELTPRQQAQFEEARPHIALSHDLVTIKTDIDTGISIEEMRLSASYTREVAELFDLYEFNSLRKMLPAGASHAEELSKPKRTISTADTDIEEFTALVHKYGNLAVNALSNTDNSVSSLVLATCPTIDADLTEAKIPEIPVCVGNLELFKEIFECQSIDKYGYGLKKLVKILAASGISLGGRLFDNSLMHYLIDPEKSHKPDMLSRSFLGLTLEDDTTEDEEEDMPANLFDIASEESSTDSSANSPTIADKRGVAAAALVGIKLRGILDSQTNNKLSDLYSKMEEPLIRVLADMEMTGVKVDLIIIRNFAEGLRKEIVVKEKDLRTMLEEPQLNISSPKQVGDVLFGKLNLDPKAKKSAKGSYPTDEATLSAIADKHPAVNGILEFRAIKKLLSTYIEPFPGYISPVDGRAHTTFNQDLTATGRLSSSNPNLQNIPIRTERGKEIRKAFVPGTDGGYIMSADYSQIELRIMAHLSQDKHLVEAFRHDQDVHAATASKIFGIPIAEVTREQRGIAKTANFGIMYGISSFGLSQRLGLSKAASKKIIEDYFEAFPAIKSYIADIIASAKENGYVETLFGRRRYLPDINSRNATVRSLAERNAVNAPIQGTSADIIKLAMCNVKKRMDKEGLRSKMVLQIHDELLFDVVPEEIESLRILVKEEMEHVTELSVPLTVECNYGKSWLEAH